MRRWIIQKSIIRNNGVNIKGQYICLLRTMQVAPINATLQNELWMDHQTTCSTQSCSKLCWSKPSKLNVSLISNFRRFQYVVCFLLGNSPKVWILYADVSEHSVCSIAIGMKVLIIINIIYLLVYEDGTECSETSAYKIQTPGNYSEENIQEPTLLISLTLWHRNFTFKF
jgi:hypothetical protein